MGLGPKNNIRNFTRTCDNHIQCIKQTRVYRNIGVLKLICENERTIWDTLSDKNMCTDLKCPGEVPGLREKQG